MVVSPCSIFSGQMNCMHNGVLHTELCRLWGIASLGSAQEGALQGLGWPASQLVSVQCGEAISDGFWFSFLVAKCRWQLTRECIQGLWENRVPRHSVGPQGQHHGARSAQRLLD